MTFAVRPIGLRNAGVPWSSVLSLLHMEGVNGSDVFTDAASVIAPWSNVVGAAQVSSTQKPFGATSGNFTNGGIRSASSLQLRRLLDESFYISGWIRPDAVQNGAFFGVTAGSTVWTGTNGLFVAASLVSVAGTHALRLSVPASGTFAEASVTTATLRIPSGAWAHFALQSDVAAGTLSLGVNGSVETFARPAVGIPTGTPFTTWGAPPAQESSGLAGYLKEARIAVGVAPLSGSTYTVPTGPYPDA